MVEQFINSSPANVEASVPKIAEGLQEVQVADGLETYSPMATLQIGLVPSPSLSDRELRRRVKTVIRHDETGLLRPVRARYDRFMDLQERKEKSPLEAKILNNFFLSFQFSQGSEDLQKILLAAISASYDPAELKSEFGSTEELNQKIGSEVTKFRLPLSHAQLPEDVNIQAEFINRWEDQLEALKPLFDDSHHIDPNDIMGKFLAKSPQAQAVEIATRMADCDMFFYERDGRDNGPKADPFESHIKRFLLDQEPTGSEDYTNLFQSVREVEMRALIFAMNRRIEGQDYLFSTLVVQSGKVQKNWMAKHPGEEFFDIAA